MPYTPLYGVPLEARTYSGEFIFPYGTFNRVYQFLANLDVTAAAGSSPTLDVTVEQSLDGGATWDDFLAFTQATGATSETLTEQDADLPNFSGDLKVKWALSSAAASGVLTVDPSGSQNKYTVTGQAANPTDDNKVTWQVVEGDPGASISVAVDGYAILVTLAKDTGTAAYLETNLAGATNNDLRFTSNSLSVAGGATTIAYVDPSANNAKPRVEVVGTDITVYLGTDGSGVITTTAKTIMTLIGNHPAARDLVTVTLKSGNDGTGLVAALTKAALSTGSAGVDPAVTSTTGNVITAVAASTPAAALVVVTNFAGNDGTGLCAATGPTALSDGTSFSFSCTGFAK